MTLGDRGRLVLPAALRRACGLEQGQEVVAVVDDDGRITIDTRGALLERLRVARTQVSEGSAVEELHDWRAATDGERARRLEHPELDPADSERRGRELLQHLGLEPR